VTRHLETWDSAAREPRALEELKDLGRHRGLVVALVERNLKVRYKRSVLGVAWSMLSPAATMAILSLVFSNVFAGAAPGYPAFILPGLLIWLFFAQSTTSVAAEVAGGIDLWRRVKVPKTAPALATVLTSLVNLLLALVPLGVLILVMRRPVSLALLSIPVVVLGATLFASGVALAIASATLHFADAADAWGIAVAAWMYATPVIYPAAILPDRVRAIVFLNPMTLYVEAFRRPFYENASAAPATLAAGLALGAGALLAGWLLFTRMADELPYRA
jgi:ABC-2 type transport system permease protein